MIKFHFKNFSTISKNISNLNSLNKFVIKNFEDFSNNDFINVFNKFQELEAKDPNAKLKLYDLLDYVMYDEKKLSDDALLKTVMRTMLSIHMYDKIYWDQFKKIILKHNLLFSTEYNFLDYMKIYSIVNYEDEEMWTLFEEYFLEMNKSFSIDEIQSMALCFGNNKKGSKKFWVSLFDTFDLKNTRHSDFILNFSVCLCGFLQSKIINQIDKKLIEYFCIYLNFSTDFLQTNILSGTSVEKIDVVYSLFTHFHKSYHVDQIHLKFPHLIEKNYFKSFLDNLENFLTNYLDKNINKLEDEDFEQISKILKYAVQNQITFHKLKLNLFIKIFLDDMNNIKNYDDLYNFLNYFSFNNIKEEKLKAAFSEETVWERFIDVMHLMSLDQLINLTVIMKNYNVKYFRIWIFLQNFFREHVKLLLDKSEENLKMGTNNFDGEEAITKIENLIIIFNDDKFKFEEYVLLPFIVFLQNSRDQIKIKNSHRIPKFSLH